MLTFKIDPKLHARVKALAAELGVSTSELVRDALKQRLAQAGRPRSKSVYEATRDLCGVAEAPDPGLIRPPHERPDPRAPWPRASSLTPDRSSPTSTAEMPGTGRRFGYSATGAENC